MLRAKLSCQRFVPCKTDFKKNPTVLQSISYKKKRSLPTLLDINQKLFESVTEFKYFRQKGAINRGRQFIKGRMLFEEIWYSLMLL